MKRLAGYAVVFNSLSGNIYEKADGLGTSGVFKEKFLPGAFAESLRYDRVEFRVRGHFGLALGSTEGTLSVWEDGEGLAFDFVLPDFGPSRLGRESRMLFADVECENVPGISIGFLPENVTWDHRREIPVRTIKKARLRHICPVKLPLYPATTILASSDSPQ